MMNRMPLHSPIRLSVTALCCTLVCGCTTIQNRRDLYFPQQVRGPYTRMLEHGLKGPDQSSLPSPTTSPTSKGSGDGKKVIRPQG